MKFSFVVPTHNRAKYLGRLLKSLVNLSTKDFEVILVGNTGDDLYVHKLAKKYRRCFPIQSAITGVAGVNRARNLGIQMAQGSIIVFIDDDCYFEKEQLGFLDRISETCNENTSIDILGGNYKLPSRPVSAAAKAYHVIAQNWFFQGMSLGPSNWCLFGGCMAIKKKVFEDGNFFDQSILFGSAESELILRCLERGYSVKSSTQFSVTHDGKLTGKDIIKKALAQSSTTSRFPVFSSSKYRLPQSLNFKESFIDSVSQGPLDRFNILRMINAYEANFAT